MNDIVILLKEIDNKKKHIATFGALPNMNEYRSRKKLNKLIRRYNELVKFIALEELKF